MDQFINSRENLATIQADAESENLTWIIEALKFHGLKEIKGAKHAPEIVQMWKDIKRGGIKDDETPWCAAFVGACLERAGFKSSRFESARSYATWGRKVDRLQFGAVVVFSRKGGGHVGFCVGVDPSGNPYILGGNQSDAVNIARFDQSRIVAIRYPENAQTAKSMITAEGGAFSNNEA